MSICDNCIHNTVCGLEGCHEEAIKFCSDMISKDTYKVEGEPQKQEGRGMRDIIIKIPDTAYEGILNADKAGGNWGEALLGILCNAITHGTPLPKKGHRRLKDVDALIDTLGCSDSDVYVKTCLEKLRQ